MTRDTERHPNASQDEAQIVAGPAARAAVDASADFEAAWREWSGRNGTTDERALLLLKSAFEAGFDAGQSANQNGA